MILINVKHVIKYFMKHYGLFSNNKIMFQLAICLGVHLSLVELIFQDKAQFIIVRGQIIFLVEN